jgi:hypothetical protein
MPEAQPNKIAPTSLRPVRPCGKLRQGHGFIVGEIEGDALHQSPPGPRSSALQPRKEQGPHADDPARRLSRVCGSTWELVARLRYHRSTPRPDKPPVS